MAEANFWANIWRWGFLGTMREKRGGFSAREERGDRHHVAQLVQVRPGGREFQPRIADELRIIDSAPRSCVIWLIFKY